MKTIVLCVYCGALVAVIFILKFFVDITGNKQYCSRLNLSLPLEYVKKYVNFTEVPENTKVYISTFNTPAFNRNINFEMKYSYPNIVNINSPAGNYQIKLKNNKVRKVLIKVRNSRYSHTYYRILIKMIRKKKLSLNDANIVLANENLIENQYKFNKLLSMVHRVIIDVDTCKDSNTKDAIPSPTNGKINIVTRKTYQQQGQKQFVISEVKEPDEKTKYHFYLLFDKSGSLNEYDKAPLKLIKMFLRDVLDNFMDKNIRVSIGAFDDNAEWLFENVRLKKETKDLAKKVIKEMPAYGGTNLYKILDSLVKKKIDKNNNNYLIIVTDGFVKYAHFKNISRNLTRRFKKIIIVGAGVEINVEFINYLSLLFKATPYFITEESDIKGFKNIINNILKEIPFSPQMSNNRENEHRYKSHIENDTGNATESLIINDETASAFNNLTRSIAFKKLYLINKNNVQKFRVNSYICNSLTIPNFSPIAYNEFFNNILLKSDNYNGKIIVSLVQFSTLTKNPRLRRKLLDLLYENYSLTFVKNTKDFHYKKTSHTIEAGNYIIKFIFSKFKLSKLKGKTMLLDNCYKTNKSYNNSRKIWLGVIIVLILLIKTFYLSFYF